MAVNWEAKQQVFTDLLLAGEADQAVEQARALLGQGVSPTELFEACLSPVLEDIGGRFQRLEIFLPELATSGEIVQRISDEVIRPAVEATAGQAPLMGKVLLGTVQGDLHDIGKNIVALMLSVNGFEVVDLGTSVPPLEFVNRAAQEKADIIGMSALLFTCLPYMKDVMDYLDGTGVRDRYAVIIGGAPTTPEYAEEIGADAYGANAAEAVDICKRLIRERQA